jgi:hypothetical protein
MSNELTASGLIELIGEYYDIGVQEGIDGRTHDTIDGKAQSKLLKISAFIAALCNQEAGLSESTLSMKSLKIEMDEYPFAPVSLNCGKSGMEYELIFNEEAVHGDPSFDDQKEIAKYIVDAVFYYNNNREGEE